MDIWVRENFEEFALGLPQATLVHQWGGTSVLKVGGKMFSTYGHWSDAGTAQISFKCSDLSYQLLSEQEGVHPAKYLARAKWISVNITSGFPPQDIQTYLRESHRLVACKLTRAIKAELGLTGDQYSSV